MKKIITGLLLMIFFSGFVNAQRDIVAGKNFANSGADFEHIDGKYADINGIKIYYEEYGDGDPMLLIHNNGGSVESYNNQINYFSKKYRVIVADNRGQGKTINTKDSITYEMMADDYFLLLNELNIDSANIIGWGDGGIIGLLMAMNYPEKVKMLGVMGANLSPDTSAIREEAIDWVKSQIKMDKDSIKAGKIKFKSDLQLKNLMYHHPNIDEVMLHSISIPVLLMSGDRDIIKLEHTLLIYNNIPQAQLCIFPGSTHSIIEELPVVFNNTVMRFFSRPFKMPDSVDGLK